MSGRFWGYPHQAAATAEAFGRPFSLVARLIGSFILMAKKMLENCGLFSAAAAAVPGTRCYLLRSCLWFYYD